MTALLWLIPAALGLGLLGLVGFVWTLRAGQYEDLDGDKARIFETEDRPLPRRPQSRSPNTSE
ncbi:MAG: cbb3-type cytochrome oxidase assembly protein CcoS [Pseudomonadota bacterium]